MSRTTALQRWSLGAAIGILAALAIAPPTGWLARIQIRMQTLGGIPELGAVAYEMQELGLKSTADLPAPPVPTLDDGGDLGLQVAAVLRRVRDSRERVPALRQLTSRFPDSPALYAHILRFATQGQVVGCRRTEESLLTNEEPPSHPAQQARAPKEQLEQFDRDAAEGERLDSDNAYFPFMRSIGLFHAYRDAEALEAIRRAAGKPRWEEYIAEEAHGAARLYEMQFGPRPALARTAVYAAILFPHLAGLRSAARVATYKAVEAELAGHTEEGFQIRMDLARLGSRMREQGRSLVCGLVGIAITNMAMTRPGGVPYVKRPPVRAASDGTPMQNVIAQESPDPWTRKQRDRFTAYLERIGKTEHAAWILQELAAGDESKRVTHAAIERSAFGGIPLSQLAIAWSVNLLTLANMFWMLALGGIAALLCRARRIRAGRPMPKPAVCGIWLGPIVAGIALVSTLAAEVVPVAATLLSVGALTAILIVRSLGVPAASLKAAVGAMVLSALAWAGVGYLAFVQSRPAHEMMSALVMVLSGGDDGPGVVVGLASFLIPVTTALVIIGVSRWSRVPISVGLSRGFRGLAAPVSCALAVIYAFSLVWTVRQEAAVNQGLERTLKHEGIYLSELMGRDWPASAPFPGSHKE